MPVVRICGVDGLVERLPVALVHVGAGDFEQFLRDAGLADFVVFECQVFDKLVGVVGGVFLGHHPGTVLARLRLQQDLVNLEIQIMRQQRTEHQVGGGFEQEFRRPFVQPGTAGRRLLQVCLHGLYLADRQERAQLRLLRERVDEIRSRIRRRRIENTKLWSEQIRAR